MSKRTSSWAELIVALPLEIAAVAVHGLVLRILWGWYAVPIFGLPPLTITQALGVSLVIGLMTAQYVPDPDPKTSHRIATALIRPLSALLMGWIFSWFL